MSERPQIIVAAGIIYHSDGRILLAQRPKQRHMEGWWEFPGGKLEPGETPHQALQRELEEELGIRVLASRPFMRVRHEYPERTVVLLVREVIRYQGIPRGVEGQSLAWTDAEQLAEWPLLPADKPIIRALLIPHQYAITPPLAAHYTTGKALQEAVLQGVDDVLMGGMRLLQLRLPDVADDMLEQLARRVASVVQQAGGRLMINQDWALAQRCGADGVHLKAAQLATLTQRPPDLDLVAASTHNAAELQQACALGCDFVCLGPVRRTTTHPQAVPLNWQGIAQLTAQVNMPVFALGGVTLDDFDQAREAGAVGIAGIRDFWGAG